MVNNHKTLSTFKYDKLGEDRESLRHSLSNRLIYSLGKDPITATGTTPRPTQCASG